MGARLRAQTARIRERVADILQASFPHWDVSADDVVPVDGFWKQVDVYRFQVFCHERRRYSNGDRVPVSAGCWLTMGQFVKEARKAGCHLSDGEIWSGPNPDGGKK